MIKAFPSVISIHNGRQEHSGMDLRDWFAGLAIQGLAMESIAFQGLGVKQGVQFAYEIADEMMKARVQE